MLQRTGIPDSLAAGKPISLLAAPFRSGGVKDSSRHGRSKLEAG
jgi:hypothetical protein